MQHSYSLEELAKFLKRSEKEIKKLAEKEIIKGRKAQGTWVFSLPDVVAWMEQEMTHMETEQTAKLEQAVSAGVSEDLENISLKDLLSIDSIDLALSAKTKASIINEIVQIGERTGKLWDAVTMAKALREREEMSSTALENGVAILHPRRPQPNIIAEDFLVLAISRNPVPFGGGRDNETDIFFLLCCQTDARYLKTLGKLARVIKTPDFLDSLRNCQDASAVFELLERTENELN